MEQFERDDAGEFVEEDMKDDDDYMEDYYKIKSKIFEENIRLKMNQIQNMI